MTDLVCDIWEACPEAAGEAVVLPDGCCDLISVAAPGLRPRWFVSDLMTTAETIPFDAGVRMKGFRLRAGTGLDRARLLAAIADVSPDDDRAVYDRLDAFGRLSNDVTDTLAALAETASVAAGARRLGVTPRTLQRLTLRETGASPLFWQRLARVRRAARDLGGPAALADIAGDHGFADQAHFSRECRAWFGETPAVLRSRSDLIATLHAPAYG